MSERIIQISKITSNRQVTIHKEVMEKLGLKEGNKIVWFERNCLIVIRKA